MSIVASTSFILGLPILWNAIGRNEYHNHTLQRLAGSQQKACYIIGACLFSTSLFRDLLYVKAMQQNPVPIILTDDTAKEKEVDTKQKKNAKKGSNDNEGNKKDLHCKSLCGTKWFARFKNALRHGFGAPKRGIKGLEVLGHLLLAVGTTLVVTSSARLGFTGVYLGDYCGLLMDQKVVSFPFNILEHPMYVGSVMNFFGSALRANSLVGIGLSTLSTFMYVVVSRLEGAFLSMVYSNRCN